MPGALSYALEALRDFHFGDETYDVTFDCVQLQSVLTDQSHLSFLCSKVTSCHSSGCWDFFRIRTSLTAAQVGVQLTKCCLSFQLEASFF